MTPDRYEFNRTLQVVAEIALMIVLAAMVALIAMTMVARAARADGVPDVKVMMGRVEAVLVMHGYPAARGYAQLEPPAAVMVDDLADGNWGAYVPGRIDISRAQPDDCVPVTLAHELTHDVTIRKRLIEADTAGAPAWLVKHEMEKVAGLVESFIGSDGTWLPGCLLRRGQ